MTEPIHKGKDLPPVWVIHAASGGDSEAMEQVLRYYDDYMSRLCTRTLYDKDGTPHVRRLRKMTEPIHKGKDLPPVWVIHAASGGDSEAMEQVLRYYDDYMSRLCTRTLYDKDGTPHVCVDVHMKRCLEIRLIRAVMRA